MELACSGLSDFIMAVPLESWWSEQTIASSLFLNVHLSSQSLKFQAFLLLCVLNPRFVTHWFAFRISLHSVAKGFKPSLIFPMGSGKSCGLLKSCFYSQSLQISLFGCWVGVFFSPLIQAGRKMRSVCIKKQNSSLLPFPGCLFLEHSLKNC